MKRLILTLALACLLPVSAHAASLAEQRSAIQDMRRDTLTKLYQAQPGTDAEIKNAAGYAVFTSADIAAIFVSGTFGHGIAHDNRSGQETFMQMASAGVGLGIGVKDFRTIFVFNDPAAYDDFVNTGLDLSGHVDVAAKQGTSGGDITGAVDVLPGVRVYQLTDTGLLAQAMLKGTKYWRDSDLNDYQQHSEAAPSYGYNP
jgi:lipid-binding SYLF domain-containing protein